MAFCDFVVNYDPEKDKGEDVTKKILYSVIVKRLKHHKPAVIFIGGDSGEGKSLSAIRLQELLFEVQGLDLKDYFHDINVYTPAEYPPKLDGLLFDKRLKKANILCMHEAREVVKAKLWRSFLTQSVADVNAMSRAVKRLCVIIISQFIRDITNDIRYTLNYYMIVRRPKGRRARLYINVMWKDDRDLEKPKLRKRKLSGYLKYPSGKMRRYVPQYLELKKPSNELVKMFEDADRTAKSSVIRRKLNKLVEEINKEVGGDSNKIGLMLDWYSKNDSRISEIGRQYRGKWKLNKSAREMHNLDREEAREFEEKLNKIMKKEQ